MDKLRVTRVFSALTLAVGLTIQSLSAFAEDNKTLPPIYFGAERTTDGKVEVKFVYSKRSSGAQRFEPTHGFSIKPTHGKRECNTQSTNDLKIATEYAAKPLYDSADPQSRVPEEKIPTFFAIVVSAELTRRGLVKTKDEALPYHTCTRILWEKLLGVNGGGR